MKPLVSTTETGGFLYLSSPELDNPKGVEFFDVNTAVRLDDERAIFKRVQHIDDTLLDRLRDERLASQHARTGDMHHVASIPVAVVEKWMAEGFNIYDPNNSIQDIVKRLNSEDMSAFMATAKKLF